MDNRKLIFINNEIIYLDTIFNTITDNLDNINDSLNIDNIDIRNDSLNIDNIDNITLKELITLITLISILQKASNTKKHTELKYSKFTKLANYNYNNYFALHNNKLISNTTPIYELYNKHIQIHERQCGGSIIDAFASIVKLGEFFGTLAKGIIWFFKFIAWLLKFVWWFIVDFLNPVTLSKDFFNSMMILIIAICRLPYDILRALFIVVINTIGGFMQGFWGWDISNLTKNDKESIYFKKFDRTKGQKCYMTNTRTVPFSIILGTILCPPMGVFMDMGTTGWINIIICSLLTLLFYLPGLCYALLIIYS